jgi:MoxR-like ATPase
VKAKEPPIVVLTSNRTREIHDAVKRRCLYHWVGFPDAAREAQILARRVPGAPAALAAQVVAFVQGCAHWSSTRRPGIAETIEWMPTRCWRWTATALDARTADETLGVLLKYQDDIERVRGAETARLVAAPQV